MKEQDNNNSKAPMQSLIEKINQCLGEKKLPKGNDAEHFSRYFLVPNFVNSDKFVLQHNHLPQVYKHLSQKDKSLVLSMLMVNKRYGMFKLPKPIVYGIIASSIKVNYQMLDKENLIQFAIEKLNELSTEELKPIVDEEFENITFSAENFDNDEKYSDIRFNPNVKNKYGYVVLFYILIKSNNKEEVKFLLGKGANPNIRNNDGATPLHYGAFRGSAQNVKRLLDHKADVNINGKDGSTLFHYAVKNEEVTKLLFERGVDVDVNINTKNQFGKTPLDKASIEGNTEVVKLLLENKATVDKKVLNYAKSSKGIEVLLNKYVSTNKDVISSNVNNEIKEEVVNYENKHNTIVEEEVVNERRSINNCTFKNFLYYAGKNALQFAVIPVGVRLLENSVFFPGLSENVKSAITISCCVLTFGFAVKDFIQNVMLR